MKKCCIKKCENKSHIKDMCRNHHRKWRLYGNPLNADRPKGMPKQFCTFPKCTKEHHARGLCDTHYMRLLTYGDPSYTKQQSREEIYHASYEKRGKDECWPWVYGLDKNGYGKIGFKRFHTDRAHRFGWELFHKKSIPYGMLVCHTCDNPPCQNPAHLFIGTAKDNAEDMQKKGRAKYYGRPKGNNGRFT